MGSQISSTGRKSDLPPTPSGIYEAPPRFIRRYEEATNTNAREHNQPDKLKFLFREQRGYRAMSEHKVGEWLTKNKQYHAIMPRDLTEIPEQIFNPLEQPPVEWEKETSNSHVNRSHSSGHNILFQSTTKLSKASKRGREKIMQLLPKPGATRPRHSLSNMLLPLSKSDLVNSKVNRQLSRPGRLDSPHKPLASDSDELLRDKSNTPPDSASSQLMHRYGDFPANKRHHTLNSRRGAYSQDPKSTLGTSRHAGDMWQTAPSTYLAPRRTVPGMFQNNAQIRLRGRLTDTCVEPMREIHPGLSQKRSQASRRHGIPVIPKRVSQRRITRDEFVDRECSVQVSKETGKGEECFKSCTGRSGGKRIQRRISSSVWANGSSDRY